MLLESVTIGFTTCLLCISSSKSISQSNLCPCASRNITLLWSISLTQAALVSFFFFFQAEDGIRDHCVTGVQTCALPIFPERTQRTARRQSTSAADSRSRWRTAPSLRRRAVAGQASEMGSRRVARTAWALDRKSVV